MSKTINFSPYTSNIVRLATQYSEYPFAKKSLVNCVVNAFSGNRNSREHIESIDFFHPTMEKLDKRSKNLDYSKEERSLLKFKFFYSIAMAHRKIQREDYLITDLKRLLTKTFPDNQKMAQSFFTNILDQSRSFNERADDYINHYINLLHCIRMMKKLALRFQIEPSIFTGENIDYIFSNNRSGLKLDMNNTLLIADLVDSAIDSDFDPTKLSSPPRKKIAWGAYNPYISEIATSIENGFNLEEELDKARCGNHEANLSLTKHPILRPAYRTLLKEIPGFSLSYDRFISLVARRQSYSIREGHEANILEEICRDLSKEDSFFEKITTISDSLDEGKIPYLNFLIDLFGDLYNFKPCNDEDLDDIEFLKKGLNEFLELVNLDTLLTNGSLGFSLDGTSFEFDKTKEIIYSTKKTLFNT